MLARGSTWREARDGDSNNVWAVLGVFFSFSSCAVRLLLWHCCLVCWRPAFCCQVLQRSAQEVTQKFFCERRWQHVVQLKRVPQLSVHPLEHDVRFLPSSKVGSMEGVWFVARCLTPTVQGVQTCAGIRHSSQSTKQAVFRRFRLQVLKPLGLYSYPFALNSNADTCVPGIHLSVMMPLKSFQRVNHTSKLNGSHRRS